MSSFGLTFPLQSAAEGEEMLCGGLATNRGILRLAIGPVNSLSSKPATLQPTMEKEGKYQLMKEIGGAEGMGVMS